MEQQTQDSIIGAAEVHAWEAPFRRVVGSMLQTGLVAARNGFHEDAEGIVASIESARPGHPSPKFAKALLLIYKGEPQAAADYLQEEFLKADPGNEMAKALTCMALHVMERGSECYDMVRDLVQSGRNEQAVSIARNLAADLKFAF
jgi:hypothetical protein